MQLLLAQHLMHPNKYRKGTPLLNLNVSQHIFRGYVPGRAFRRAKKGILQGKRDFLLGKRGVLQEKRGVLQGDRKGRPYHTAASQADSMRYVVEELFYLWQWYFQVR